jgi:predicted permease
VAAQVGLCLVLLVSASAFLRDLREARRFDPGFRTARLGVVSTDMRLLDRSPAAVQAFFTAWLERVRSRPDTEAAALAASLPLGLGRPLTRVQVDGVEPPGPEGFEAGWNRVSPGYFHALGIPLVSGRDFDQGDREGAEPVAIVSRSTAERLFAGQEPLGRGLRHQGQVLRVVGVVSDTAVERSGRRDHLFFYMPFAQGAPGRASLILRGPGPPRLEEARREALALEPDLPVIAARSFEEHAGAALFRQRLAASVTGAFGLLGLLLATVGLYGIVSYFALQRRRELAIRAALGARSVDLRRLVLAQGLGPLALGLVLGLSAALALSRVVAGVLPTVGAFDPVAFGIPAAVLGGAALLAADLPARRAAGRPPIVSLRAE